jgi:histidinol dehydrogenase
MKILKTGAKEAQKYIKNIINRRVCGHNVEKKVGRIIEDVKKYGDAAILKYTRLFDCPGMKLADLKVSKKEILDSYDYTQSKYLSAISLLIERISSFEKGLKPKSWSNKKGGVTTGQYAIPLEKIGIYVPGGAASYPSSLVMCAVPAKLAGVKRIIVVSPPDKKGKLNPYLLAAADKLGISEIYKAGGAQAVAGLAYGTKTIPGVDKIVGPGNLYVTMAKKAVFGDVDIDFLAGPSEVLILADGNDNAQFIASDLLSQAEHSPDASAVCITPSLRLAENVKGEIESQIKDLSRKNIINFSLKNCTVIVTRNMDEGINLANQIASEHVEVFTKNPFSLLHKIKNAGTIFLGPQTPVAIGDYMAGPSHVLPTAGSARFFSPLSVRDFVKVSNIVSCTEKGLRNIGKAAIRIAEIEGLDAHIKSIEVRIKSR